MAFYVFLIFSLTHTAVGLQSSGKRAFKKQKQNLGGNWKNLLPAYSDHLMMAATIGDDVVLPCRIPDIKSCSSVSWTKAGDLTSQVVSAGRVTPPNNHKLSLQQDCSLRVSQVTYDDARTYICSNGVQNTNVSLYIVALNIVNASKEGTVELHCSLNTYKGYSPCKNRNIHIEWSWEDNTPLKGHRFIFENPSECFSKLLIHLKPTDHQRKWKCRLFQNSTLKAAISKTTTIQGGVEEVFAAVGESVSLSCRGNSALVEGGKVKWTENKHRLTGDIASQNGQTGAFHVTEGSPTLVISKVSAVHAAEYQCSESSSPEKVINIWLYTLDVASESAPGGRNLTLTCVLTCTRQCGEDFELTWSGHGDGDLQSDLVNESNTLMSRLVLPASPVPSDELTCLVLREGGVVKSKSWHSVSPLWTPAWLALPLILFICTATGGLYMWKKRRLNRHSGNEESDTRMISIYHEIRDATEEEQQQHTESKVETITTTDSFYDLLQAVH
ncbi:uncharacterized protein LOC142888514 isoform X2 [Nelusetta ayraudi]|uniref:uncharacterized protein LOC142888514 isoform X2 n=1 Tax=Nelusetta ayraudi TaxID=303726 RepID=UPI003F6EC422